MAAKKVNNAEFDKAFKKINERIASMERAGLQNSPRYQWLMKRIQTAGLTVGKSRSGHTKILREGKALTDLQKRYVIMEAKSKRATTGIIHKGERQHKKMVDKLTNEAMKGILEGKQGVYRQILDDIYGKNVRVVVVDDPKKVGGIVYVTRQQLEEDVRKKMDELSKNLKDVIKNNADKIYKISELYDALKSERKLTTEEMLKIYDVASKSDSEIERQYREDIRKKTTTLFGED